jgi:hypothetical protein
VIRLARGASGMTAQSAAEASRAHDGKGVSAAYWRDVERGYGGRRGQRVPTRASAMALAAMARVVGVRPPELAEAGREDAARVLEEILRREQVPATPEPARDPAEPDDADDVTRNIMVAAGRPEERRIWAAIRRRLETIPEGARLLASAPQAALWPPETGGGRWGGAPVELTPQAISVLNSTPVDVLADDAITHAAFRLTEYEWPDRVGLAAVMRGRIGRPTAAVRRAG